MSTSLELIAAAVRDGDHRATTALVRDAVVGGAEPLVVLSEGLIKGIRDLGQLFKDGEAFLPEILVSARAMNKGLEQLRPNLAVDEGTNRGTVVIGTVRGDLHDIGKNLVRMLLSCNGFTVIDLGVDVSADDFVTTARERSADVIALSSLLTTSVPQFRNVMDALDDVGLRRKVAVLIGGAPVSRALADEIGAEGFADDCVTAVDEATRIIAETGRWTAVGVVSPPPQGEQQATTHPSQEEPKEQQ